MKKYLVFILICTVLASVRATEHHYYFEHFGVEDGLSQNTVNAILQDSNGFLWFGTKDGLNRYDGLSFRQYKYDSEDSCSLGNNFITALHEDRNGRLWVGTDVGLYLYNPHLDKFSRFELSSREGVKIERSVSTILADEEGRIWIAVEEQGLFCCHPDSGTLVNYDLRHYPAISTDITSFTFDSNGTLWIGFYGGGLYYSNDGLATLHPYKGFESEMVTDLVAGTYNRLYVGTMRGLWELNLTSNRSRCLLGDNAGGADIYCRDLLMVSDDKLWAGTESGIYICDVRRNRYAHLVSSMFDPYSLADNAIYSLCRDSEGGIWVGSYFGGVNYYPRPYTYFEKYYPRPDGKGLRGRRVREFCRDNQGILWIGTEDGGLTRFNPQTEEFSFFEPSAAFTNIHGLCLVGDRLWVGTFSKGIQVIDTRNGEIVKTYRKDGTAGSLPDNGVFSIFRTAAGEIFVGTLFGLWRYDSRTDGFEPVRGLEECFVYDICEDYGGNLWLATYADGAWRYDVGRKRWENYVHNAADPTTLPYDKVLSLFEDSRHRMWLTTQGGGFCRFDEQTGGFVAYGTREGLPNDVVYQIAEDRNGLFWLTTNKGLACFDPVAERVLRVYTTAGGLLSDQFNYRSSFVAEDGTIYFGSIDGFIAFNPTTFDENHFLPPVVLTAFSLFNQEVKPGLPDSPLKESIVFADRISLRSDQNSFSLGMAALSFCAPSMNRLMYKLEGWDDDWQDVQGQPVVGYSNLPYGQYVFRVKGANSDGVWNPQERVLHIEILPPFYLTGWAYCIYVLLVVGCTFYVVWYFRQRSNRRQRRAMEKFEQEKEREVYRAKFDFFTNVAHEIRTPLTLIKGPLENILLHGKVDDETREDLGIMQQNTERLLNLTNQLLDFRKAEKQGYRLNFAECDITQIVRETYLRFTSMARQRGLDFTLDVPDGRLHAHVNQEAFTKMLSNLLNNAVKYAASRVHVSLLAGVVEDGKAVFIVSTLNDGRLVPAAMKEAIFKPFVRMEGTSGVPVATGDGTGIGLALARSLAELHRGSLVMTDRSDVNEFRLTLPVVQAAAIRMPEESEEEQVKLEVIPDRPGVEAKGNRLTVLVVEDDREVQAFIGRQLAHDYEVLTAADGAEALKVLDGNFVNLVVSDVMMPVMDGFELCKTIKSDLNYSHIPVVLLTAKTDMQSKLEGLETGADAYIEKPFSPEYLLAVIANLISNREKLCRTFTRSPFVAVGSMALTKPDEEFIRKLNELILANLGNPDFATDDMADSMNMSRSNFYRKIKGVLNLTPNEYLRIERLKRAAQLLKEGECRVSEVCYAVGFNSPSYFAKLFQKQFGVLPKDFVK